MELRSKLQKVSHVWMWGETFQAEEIALVEAQLAIESLDSLGTEEASVTGAE